MFRILVTNDDGVQSPGLAVLAEALAPLGEITVTAPMSEASAIGHALTLRRPLRIEHIAAGIYGVDGTPTDCVMLGGRELVEGAAPDLVLSGVNRGQNIAEDVTLSGTVAGAIEGMALGIPAHAVGTARALQESDECGAFAALAMSLMGVITAVLLPLAIVLLL